jgi:alkanesulfonate monooxygenase SsuD/methylene tetrahydromethanopterin reductase-like flavin-dependent oxidoreductase (luciferase family)
VNYALYIPPFASFGDVHYLIEIAVAAEAAGWDGVYLWDHILFEDDVPFVDAWITLAAIASATERIRIGPLITPLPRRRPWKVAREAITLDHLSRGRLTLGVGLGIDFWREFSAFAGEAPDDRTRARLLDDGIEIVRGLLSGEQLRFAGDAHSVEAVRFLPRPVQKPTVPIWSAALWPLRDGPVRRAAKLDGVMPFKPNGAMTPDDVGELRARISEFRGDAPLDVCLHGPREWISDYESAGVTWWCEDFYWETPRDEALAIVAAGPPG